MHISETELSCTVSFTLIILYIHSNGVNTEFRKLLCRGFLNQLNFKIQSVFQDFAPSHSDFLGELMKTHGEKIL